uniref:Uncharacterized protein n=1 Tax=Denticeps clupeoides TaxID=299321 RepID=A0AAY3ZXI4_9TELE
MRLMLLLLLCLTPCVSGGKVLVWPGEFSHWLNMKTILDKLVEMGHTVTVITHTATPSVMTKRSAGFNFEILQVPHTTEDSENVLNEMLKYWMYDMEKDSFIQVFLKMSRAIDKMMAQNYALCRAMFAKKDLLEKLKMEQYDVVLEDPMSLCGDLVADVLGLPLVLTIRFSFGNTIERHVGKLPSPLSFRLKNHLFCFFHDVLYHVMVWQTWDHLYTELRGKPTKASEILGKADIWLIRTNWDFEYPRPFLPNFKFVGGLHCKPSKPLPDSPDLNPIEHLWDVVEQEIRVLDVQDVQQLRDAIMSIWTNISEERFQNLVESTPRRIKAALKAKWGSNPVLARRAK